MKYTDYLNLFDKDEAVVAIFSTFNFDPAFFEARLLRSKALEHARRIIVYMDATEYCLLAREGTSGRYINRRYLLVPIKVDTGVFHPKLSLLLSNEVAHVICGSNNITQPGCTHNLELVNSLSARFEENQTPANQGLVRDSLKFFASVAEVGGAKSCLMAKQWIEEMPNDLPWLLEEVANPKAADVQLISSLDISLWEWVKQALEGRAPSDLTIISPFYDKNLGLLKRLQNKWPRCAIRLFAQQNTSNLPAKLLKKNILLHEVTAQKGRRLHAKLVAFHAKDRILCIAGSANFTTAAFDALNLETCLAWWQTTDPKADLFDAEIKCSAIKPEDFVSSSEDAPEDLDEPECGPLVVEDAYLDEGGTLTVSYAVAFPQKPKELSAALFVPSQPLPVWSCAIPNCKTGIFTSKLPESVVSQITGAVICALVAIVNNERIEGLPFWVVQEARLTHDADGGGSATDIEKQIEETGGGLLEHLEDLGARLGVQEVIEYLRNLRIRYSEGDHGSARRLRRFQVKGHNPIRPDSVPTWLTALGQGKVTLEEAIYDFLDRHERYVLWRHARKGNLNGVPNFLDVFRTMVRLVYSYYRLKVVSPERLIGRICEWLKICYTEAQDDQQEPEGYFISLSKNYAGDKALLKSQLVEQQVANHLYAALLIAQMARMTLESKSNGNPASYLSTSSDRVKRGLSTVGIAPPTPNDVVRALKKFEVCSDEEAAAWVTRCNTSVT